VRSALGEPLRAEIEIPQLSSEEASTLQASMGTPQAFRAAGINYSPALAGTHVTLQRRANGQAYLRIVGNRPVNEPYVGVVIEANWANGRVVRDYTLLLDPPGREALPAVVATQPQAPAPEPSAAPARPAVAEQVTPRSGAAPAPKASPRPERAAASGGGEQVAIQRGDTLRASPAPTPSMAFHSTRCWWPCCRPTPGLHSWQRQPDQGRCRAANAQCRAGPDHLASGCAAGCRGAKQGLPGLPPLRGQGGAAQPQDAGGSQTASGSVQAQVSERQAPAPAPDQLKISRAARPAGPKPPWRARARRRSKPIARPSSSATSAPSKASRAQPALRRQPAPHRRRRRRRRRRRQAVSQPA
jgi:pilus assembly protein FimV